MSTKIYNGFRINAGSPLANLNVLSTIREPLQVLVDRKAAQVLAERITDEVDRYCVVQYCHEQNPDEGLPADWASRASRHIWWDITRDVRREQRECRASLERSPLIDCDVTLFLRADPVNGLLYGHLQEEQVGAYEALLSLPGVEDYAYWNNTDRPDGLSEQEWENRRSTWNRLYDANLACIELRLTPADPSPDQVLAFVPSREQRARDRAIVYLENSLYRSWAQRKRGELAADRSDLSGVYRFLSKVQRRIKRGSPVYARPLHSLTATFQTVLPVDLAPCLSKSLGDLQNK